MLSTEDSWTWHTAQTLRQRHAVQDETLLGLPRSFTQPPLLRQSAPDATPLPLRGHMPSPVVKSLPELSRVESQLNVGF